MLYAPKTPSDNKYLSLIQSLFFENYPEPMEKKRPIKAYYIQLAEKKKVAQHHKGEERPPIISMQAYWIAVPIRNVAAKATIA